MNALTDLCLSFDSFQLEKVLTRCLSFRHCRDCFFVLQNHTFSSVFPSHVSLGGCRVPWNQDQIEAVSPCCFDEHNRNGSQHSVHFHCYLGICALWHLLFLSFTIVCDRNISLLRSEGSGVRVVDFRVDSSLCFIREAPMCVSLRFGLILVKSVLIIHHGPMVTYDCFHESKQ